MNKTGYQIVFGLLVLLGAYYIYTSYAWYSTAIEAPNNPNSTIFYSPDSFLLGMLGGFLIIVGSIIGLNFKEASTKIFGKGKMRMAVAVALIVIGFYLATLQPEGVMLGMLR